MSYKQELTQLHQLLAHIRFHAKNELGLPAELNDLDAYKEVGITSLDLNADIETQLDAVMTLSSELAGVMEGPQRPERPTEATSVPSTGQSTQKVLLTDTEDWTVDAAEVAATSDRRSTPTDSTTVTDTAAETSSDEYTPKVIGGYEQDTETTENVDLVETSLQQWDAIREKEERKPIEQWGDTEAETATTDGAATPESEGTDQEKPAETERPGEQMTLPIP